MKRTEILKETLSCRIHPELKGELSTEAYANGQTTSNYVEGLLFNRHQIIDNDAKDYSEKFYLAQEELDNLHQQYDVEIENLKLQLSEANQKTEKHENLLAQLQEWQDYVEVLKDKNLQLSQLLTTLTEKLNANLIENEELVQKETEIEETQPLINEDKEVEKNSNRSAWFAGFIISCCAIAVYFIFKYLDKNENEPQQATVASFLPANNYNGSGYYALP